LTTCLTRTLTATKVYNAGIANTMHKSKFFWAILFISVVLFGTLMFYVYRYFVPVVNPTVLKEKQINPLPLVPAQINTEVESGKYYTITVSYPSSVSEIKDYIDKAKADLMSIVPTNDADAEYTMTIKTEVFSSPTTISYVVQNYSYLGGAHGIIDLVTFVYDTEGELVTLGSLLKDGNSLTTLSEKARTYFYNKFLKSSSKEVIDQGTVPVSQNWERFYLTDQGIVFIFGQYSIGPYVLGIQEFVVSYSDGQSFLEIPSR